MELALLIDCGSTYTKVTVVDLETEAIVKTAQSFTTVSSNIMLGLESALQEINMDLGQEMPFTYKAACSSAAGGLKIVAIGLVKNLTAEAAKLAALGAGARILSVYANELTPAEIEEIAAQAPDIILLAGGTDGGNKRVLLHNARMLCALTIKIPVIIAGNKVAAPEAARVLSDEGFDIYLVANVMPDFNVLNIQPAQQQIREIFLQKIIAAKGLQQIEAYTGGQVMPTPAAVLQAVELLARGTGAEQGMGDLLAVDPGGATTDVYSVSKGAPSKSGVIWKGLPEPEVKRTVEGDLGMRYNASALVEHVGFARLQQLGIDDAAAFQNYINRLTMDPGYLATCAGEEKWEMALATAAVETALERHAGKIEIVYTPLGASYLQYGKDLTDVRHFIATGGVLVKHGCTFKIICTALEDTKQSLVLKPRAPEIWLDQKYIMAAMGLLSAFNAGKALRILKKYLVNLGRADLGTKE